MSPQQLGKPSPYWVVVLRDQHHLANPPVVYGTFPNLQPARDYDNAVLLPAYPTEGGWSHDIVQVFQPV